MPSKNHFFCFGVLIVSLSAGSAKAGSPQPGYLPRVGPTPLRFFTAPQPGTKPLVLEPKAETLTNSIPMLTEEIEPMAEPPQLIEEPMVSPEPPKTSQVDPAPESPVPEPVSAQMLLKYFRKSAVGNVKGVVVPMDFTPPRAASAPSSKATYSTTP